MKWNIFLFTTLLFWITLGSTKIIRVPGDQPSIQSGINSASSGDTVLVAPGVYQENLTINNKAIVLASEYINTKDKSIIDQTQIDAAGGKGIVIKGQPGVLPTIIGLTIKNGDDGIYPTTKFNIYYSRIINNKDGIDYESGSGGECKYNIFEENRDDGIDLDGDVDIVIEENIIRNNRDDGIEIRLHPYSGTIVNYIIRHNLIIGNGEDGIQLIDYPDLSSRFFLIERNVIANNAMVGIGLMSDGNTKENYEGASIPEKIFLFNNTFVGNNYGLTGGDTLVALNNIFIGHQTLALKNVDGGSIVSYNLLWNNGSDFENSNMDLTYNLNTNPLLNDDYSLKENSPAIDAGVATFQWQGQTVLQLSPSDYVGTAPDLGAYEYGSSVSSISPLKFPKNSLLRFQIQPNYPDPFNPSTTIPIQILQGSANMVLKAAIYNLRGEQIYRFPERRLPIGNYYYRWDGRNSRGETLSSGIYFFRMQAGAQQQTEKMILMR